MIRSLSGNMFFAGSVTIFPLLSYLCNLSTFGYENYVHIIYGQIVFEIFMVLVVRSIDFRFIRMFARKSNISNIQYLIGFRILAAVLILMIFFGLRAIQSFNNVIYLYLIAGTFAVFNFEAVYQAAGEQMKLAKLKFIQLFLFLMLSLINIYFNSLLFIGFSFVFTNLIYILSMILVLQKQEICNIMRVLIPKKARKSYYRRIAFILLNKIAWLTNTRITYALLGIHSSPALLTLYDFYYKCYGTIPVLGNVLNNTFLKDVVQNKIRKEILFCLGVMSLLVFAVLIQFLVNNILIDLVELPVVNLAQEIGYIVLFNMSIISISSLIGVIFLISGNGSKYFYNSTYLMIFIQFFVFSILYQHDKLGGIYLFIPITAALISELLYRTYYARR